MTPQATFMVLAPVSPGRLPELRERLASMTGLPGHARPDNPVVPFARLPTVHVARLFILDDDTLEDVRIYGLEPRNYPPYLVFLGDVDGEADAFVDEVARVAPEGLRSLFSCCEGWRDGGDLAGWMRAHAVRSSATYVNRPGRTVQRVREEAALRDALDVHVACHPELEGRPARDVHAELRRLALEDVAAGRLALSPERPTPLGWRLRNLLHLLGVPLALLLLSPLLLLALLLAAVRLRRLEKTDAELCSRTDPAHATALARIEDVDLTNQFTALGSLKPGLVRRWVTRFVLLVIDWFARHVYTRGRLARVRTIHFARWVSLDGGQRVAFLSNYDGSLESYMDDFINKVGFGLNLVFSNGIGYPRARWLFLDGCSDERKFKEYLRRHQRPTDVWYKACPGVTAVDMERNSRIREGLEKASPGDAEAREWLALL